jgi:hypothetical protein
MLIKSGHARHRAFHHGGPSDGEIIPIITATAHRQQAPRAVSVGKGAQSTRGVAVGCDGVLQMRDQISPEAVRSTL